MSLPFDDAEVFHTTVWSAGAGCHGGCGQKLYVKNGKVVYVEGDENHSWNQGRSCPRVLALTQYMYHKDRITTPLKRVGPRGSGKFEPISWDEALDTCERKLREIKEQFGAESTIFVQGTGRDIGGPISFLCYSYGSPNWVQLGLSGHSCYTPRLGAMKATMGDFCIMDAGQFHPKRYDNPEYQVPKVIMVWGQEPPPTCSDAFYGHWVVDCMKRGSKIIAVDPRVTWTSSRAKYHLQLRPGTDGMLALSMLNVIIDKGLYDKEFVANWTYGFDKLAERVSQYDVKRAETITGVPAQKIIDAACFYAENKPAAVQWGLPVDMAPEGVTVAQAVSYLWGITGNIDIPGGNVIAKPAMGITTYPYSTEELVELYGQELVDHLNKKRIGANRYPMVKNFRGWAHPDCTLDQIESGDPYPIKAAWVQTANLLGGQAYDTKRHYEIMKKLDFIVMVDLFHNPTSMALADIFLPAATFAEKNSYRTWWTPLRTIQKAVQVGECRSDWEINLEMARRFKPELPKTPQELFSARILPKTGLTFEEVVAKGGKVWPKEGDASLPYYRYKKGLLRDDGQPGFRTETGKLELYSKTFESWDMDPLPFYKEPIQSEISTPELFKQYPLVMITGARSHVFFHSEHRMIPWLREKDPWPYVEVHPETAQAFNVYDGEWIYIENNMGKIKRKVKITYSVTPKTVQTPHHWWLPEANGPEPDLFKVWDYQINCLVPGPQDSVAGFGGAQYKTTLVKLSKIQD